MVLNTLCRRARLDYLALPATEGGNDLRLLVRELMMSILYEQYERCVCLCVCVCVCVCVSVCVSVCVVCWFW
jgi:hypothetical protein